MGRFYTSTTNLRGKQTTSMSHKGQSTHSRGWESGVRVESFINLDDKDCFRLFQTGGSNGVTSDVLLGEIIDGEFQCAKSLCKTEEDESFSTTPEEDTLENAMETLSDESDSTDSSSGSDLA